MTELSTHTRTELAYWDVGIVEYRYGRLAA
jgi:hypothetical protein